MPLRFTLGAPGVATAIVGTEKPERWRQNASLLAKDPLDAAGFEAIRARRTERAGADWADEV